MMRSLRVHQCIDFLGAARSSTSTSRKMMVRRGTLRAIAVLVLLASVSLAESVKLRKPRRRTTTRTPSSYNQQSRIGPVIIRVMRRYTGDGASGGCANGNCRNARDKFNVDVNEAIPEEDNFLSDEESLRYVVHPEKYEHFVLRKNTGHASRYKRDAALSELHSSSDASDRTAHDRLGDGSEASRRNENRGNFTRVPLYRIERTGTRDLSRSSRSSRSSSGADRARRSPSTDYSSRRNDSDYYAQRKAVMERYHARQREINARYAANRSTSVTPRLERNDVSQRRPATSAALFNLGRVYPGENSAAARDSATFRHPSAKIDPIYSNESRYNKIPTELDSRRNIAPELELRFKPDADFSRTRSSGNIERDALDYFVTPAPCVNLSSSGTVAPKTRPKHVKNCIRETERSNEDCDRKADNGNTLRDNLLRWGSCEGRIVYQHNLLLGLTGPSNLDALFEVIIQGPVCITCVEALRYNETRAKVTLDSGGRGHEYAKLRLQGYENEGFSYIIKVWGVNKTGQVCDNVD